MNVRPSAILHAVVIWMAVPSPVLHAASEDFYISPDGNDGWSGRLAAPNGDRSDGPLASVKAAQLAVRKLRAEDADRRQPVVVALRGGTYWLEEALAFSPEDSGTREVAGGLSGVWRRAAGAERRPAHHRLEGRRRRRVVRGPARGEEWSLECSPSSSSTTSGDSARACRRRGTTRSRRSSMRHRRTQGKGSDRFGFSGDEIRADWENLRDVEVMAFHNWAASRIPIASVDAAGHAVTLQGHTTGTSSWAQFIPGTPVFPREREGGPEATGPVVPRPPERAADLHPAAGGNAGEHDGRGSAARQPAAAARRRGEARVGGARAVPRPHVRPREVGDHRRRASRSRRPRSTSVRRSRRWARVTMRYRGLRGAARRRVRDGLRAGLPAQPDHRMRDWSTWARAASRSAARCRPAGATPSAHPATTRRWSPITPWRTA